MLDMLCDDDAAIKVSKLPSNLTEVPKVHEKYEINSFCQTNPQYRANLKTMEIISNNRSGQAILNLNPGLFGGISEKAKQPVDLKDPYADILEKQPTWQNVNKIGPAAGGMDLINYSELYHPLSHHNVSCGNERTNQMPSDLAKAQAQQKLVQKGFYDKEALVLDKKYEHTKLASYGLRQLDPRLRENEYMLGQPNMAVHLNQGLMAEIQRAQQQREYERGLRPDPPAPLMRGQPPHLSSSQKTSIDYQQQQQLLESSMGPQQMSAEAKNFKDRSQSSFHQGTNRTTVPSQLNGGMNEQSTNSILLQGSTTQAAISAQDPPLGGSGSQTAIQRTAQTSIPDHRESQNMFQVQITGAPSLGGDDVSSPEVSPERVHMAPQMDHMSSPGSALQYSTGGGTMDERVRHELQSTSNFEQNVHQQSQGSEFLAGGKRSVRFDHNSMDSQSPSRGQLQYSRRSRDTRPIEEEKEDMNIDERDSEDPESDDTIENRYRQVDPQLDAQIRAIRQGKMSSAGKTSSSQVAVSQATYGTQVDSRPGAHGSKSSAQNAPTTADDQTSSNNLSKLEDVLKRQRERLESMGELTSSNVPEVISNEMNQRSSSHYPHKSQTSQFTSELSPERSSPMRCTQGMQSDGVYSSSTNNLEKAYEDLEREILEIKMKLQGSSIGPGGNADQQPSQHEVQQQNDFAREHADNMAQSLGSTGLQRSQVQNLAMGQFQPAHSMTAHASRQAAIYHDQQQNTANRTVGNRSSQRSPNRSGTHGGNYTQGAADLDEHDYSLSVSDLNSNSLYRSGRYGGNHHDI